LARTNVVVARKMGLIVKIVNPKNALMFVKNNPSQLLLLVELDLLLIHLKNSNNARK
jgi:hypothetical protein